MLISAKSEYAIRALVELAAADGEGRTCEEIAEAQLLPRAFLGRILNDLRRSEIVRSQRGHPGGGWRLARPASAITLTDVVTAMDGLLEVREPSVVGAVEPSGAAALRDVWTALGRAVHNVLTDLTIAELTTSEGKLAVSGSSPQLPRENGW